MQQLEIPVHVKSLLRQVGQIAQRLGMQAYAVGGCVRDWNLGIPDTPDLDITVEGDGIRLARDAARLLGGGPLRVHEQFGTATLVFEGRGVRRIDVATCRKETYARPAAYPRVSPGTLEDDLFRRDFTINAMAVALDPAPIGALIDPFGGRRDLDRRTLRVLHPDSFLDDPSRMLRGIRFAQRFHGHYDEATRHLMKEALQRGALGWLNEGRLQKEFEQFLREPDPAACFRALRKWLEP